MQLNYLIISQKDLTEIEKIVLSCSGKPFCFLRRKGVLLINKELGNTEPLAELAADLWEHDQIQDDQGELEVDSIYTRVKKIAGSEAASQLLTEWNDFLQEKLNADNRRDASEWLQGRDLIEELDAIESYAPGIVSALWSLTRSTDAIFLYGYLAGVEAARKAVSA